MKAKRNETDRRPYRVLNRVFLLILLPVIFYSILYSPENARYPVPSGPRAFFKKASPSEGLSRSFSAIVRFDLKAARQYNPHGPRIFVFFLIQLLMRFAALLLLPGIPDRSLNSFYISDMILSLLLFIYCFWPFLSELAYWYWIFS